MQTRGITKADYDEIVTQMDHWWGGPAGVKPLPIFYYEFGEHALIVEEAGSMIGFLLGFVTEGHPRVAYVHLIGIHPQYRRRGVARMLYEEFAKRAESRGAAKMKAITTAGNEGSVEFHRALGFGIEEVPNYAGPGFGRYVFTRELHPSRSN
jgi:ribosomal protein S18 acetylase RimI-like enzyme